MATERSVLKFGGSSATRPDAVAEIFCEDRARNGVAVLSAVGKDPDATGDDKITDHLLRLEEAVDRDDRPAIAEAQEFVIERNRTAYSMLGEGALQRVLNEVHGFLQPANRKNGYAWVGEYASASLFAELTGAVHVLPDLRFSGGVLRLSKSTEAIQKRLLPLLKAGKQVVTEGFFGNDLVSGDIVTLPRGGSDTSGVVYAGALNGADCGTWINENYTDKDGILSADPDIVTGAIVIPAMTHDEVREKMHCITERNGVVHGDAIAYAARLGVEMHVKNTFNRSSDGTRITPSREADPDHPVIGIAGKSNLIAITTYDMGMADAENYVTPILEKIGELGMAWSNIPTGEDRLKIIFNSGTNEANLDTLQRFILDRAISGDKAEVTIQRNQGAVYIVGQELVKPLMYTKTLGKVATVLSAHGLSMREVISHEQSPSLALSVDGEDVDAILRLLHEKLIG